MNYVYLDNAATTKPNENVLQKALEISENNFYNPSALYNPARGVKKIIDEYRAVILQQFSSAYELTFTSSGTEADNTAIFSFARRGNVVSTAGEHSAVYSSFMQLKQQGVETRFAKLNEDGSVNEQSLLELIDDKTQFVSIVHVNNETGAINDINKLAKLCKQKNSKLIFHSDGVQAFLKINYQIANEIDLYSISAHKICALKGVGALIYKKGLNVKPLLHGGGQEKNVRSGTENTFGIFAFGEAVKNFNNVIDNYKKVSELKDLLKHELAQIVKFISGDNSSPYILTISLPGIKAEIMQRLLEEKGVLVGTGSACSSKLGTSRIITNCGLDKKVGEGVLRISFSFTTTKEEVYKCAEAIKDCSQRLKVALK